MLELLLVSLVFIEIVMSSLHVFLVHGKLPRTCSIDSCWRLYPLLLCVFTNDSYTLVQYRCSCVIQYLGYLERLMDYIICGLYGTSCARGGPLIYMWY